jgi:hypothetical protein
MHHTATAVSHAVYTQARQAVAGGALPGAVGSTVSNADAKKWRTRWTARNWGTGSGS